MVVEFIPNIDSTEYEDFFIIKSCIKDITESLDSDVKVGCFCIKNSKDKRFIVNVCEE